MDSKGRDRITTVTDVVTMIQASAAAHERELYLRQIPSRLARFGQFPPTMHPLAVKAAQALGIEQPWIHQSAAIEHALAGEDVVIATGTASGKSLCYHLPVISALASDPKATALYLFPTKALSQDQLRSLNRICDLVPELTEFVNAGVYDGDTPPPARRKIRQSANLVITNPEMLHQGLLPHHVKWGRFLANLRYIVLDELHSLRGIFGSHVALVIRRLLRLARMYGSDPVFICTSATIANPEELSQKLTGKKCALVLENGSPCGNRYFLIANPRLTDRELGLRRSANLEGQELFTYLINERIQTIAFCRTRQIAELVYRYARDTLPADLARRIAPYRSGYLPEERRAIERALFSGELLGVVSTNALELGIDIGSLDASILIGYPGTVASLWQQAGRAGRREHDSLSILVAYDDPIDQYYFHEPEDLLGRPVEEAIIDPSNPYILWSHIRCAAKELALRREDLEYLGASATQIAEVLDQSGDFSRRNDVYYWAKEEFPAAKVNLRTVSTNMVNIVDSKDNRVVGTIDEISALETVYPQAVYIHEGVTYFVDELDWEKRLAIVTQKDVEYYTQAMVEDALKVLDTRKSETKPAYVNGLGDVKVSWVTIGFKKIRFGTAESLGWAALELPQMEMDTVGLWLIPGEATRTALAKAGFLLAPAMAGLRNLMRASAPLLAMCDRGDISSALDSSNFGVLTIFLYDYYPGGIGYSERLSARMPELLARCLNLAERCGCRAGCPSCVGSTLEKVAQFKDLDLVHNPITPQKAGTIELLHLLLD